MCIAPEGQLHSLNDEIKYFIEEEHKQNYDLSVQLHLNAFNGEAYGCEAYCYNACGDCGGTTKERYLEILEFTHFVEFFSFNKIGENHKEKILVQRVTVVVALDLGTGNTKNLEYENE